MKLNQIRQSFLEFFKNLNHVILPSSSLVPDSDPSLIFTNAGMVQFKNYFTGLEKPDFIRAATSQKCVRAGGKHNDLENVGYTARHHTFFEMLGNFSFSGGYFKDFAIEAAWKYLTEVLCIDKRKLYITVYHDDDEAYNIWKKLTGFSSEKIIRITTNDNFWSMGDLGPCGPCSEIFFDHGDKYQGGLPGTPDEGGDRYIEIWNLVFMQYEQIVGGERVLLPKPAIDTGMGLERVTAVMQGVNDNYDTDLFQKLRQASIEISHNGAHEASHKVISDHLRSSCFLLADGVMPSNDGRGYVLRRIMRRAMRHVHMLGCKEPMMDKLVDVLISEMGEAYPELVRAKAVISSVLQSEEERFGETLGRGMKILSSKAERLKSGDILSGDIAFNLYDTYGFPLDLTQDILRSNGITVDEDGFNAAMKEQRIKAKASWHGSGDKAADGLWYSLYEKFGATEFIGYEESSANAEILAIIYNGAVVERISGGDAIIVIDKTPFYAESGGQVGDIGLLGNHVVTDVKKYSHGIWGHHVKINGSLSIGDNVLAYIDLSNRKNIMANHSATHLLHKALRDLLGDHVTQKGSIVMADKLRFDFSHNQQMSKEQIAMAEKMVNAAIIANDQSDVTLSTQQEAVQNGAMALFGEKYGDSVRVVSLGRSVELCGGTHVLRTGDIGYFKIVSESSVASGVRRIEALTGMHAVSLMNEKEEKLKSLMHIMKCSEDDLMDKFNTLQSDIKRVEKDLMHYKGAFFASDHNAIKTANGHVVYKILFDLDQNSIKVIAEILKNKYQDSLIFVVNIIQKQSTIMIMSSGVMLDKLNARDASDFLQKSLGGKGGGNAMMAQLGGCNISGIDDKIKELSKLC